jgi:hypothetical protein
MNLNENILRVKEVMGLIAEDKNPWLRRRFSEIDGLVDLALSRVNPIDYSYHDYVEEIAWQVADEYGDINNSGIEDILDYVRENFWKKIETYYLKAEKEF